MTWLIFQPDLVISLESLERIASDQAKISSNGTRASTIEGAYFQGEIYVCDTSGSNHYYYWAENHNAHPSVINNQGYLYYKFGYQADSETGELKFKILGRSQDRPSEVKQIDFFRAFYSTCRKIKNHDEI